jgi:hypothetical protein
VVDGNAEAAAVTAPNEPYLTVSRLEARLAELRAAFPHENVDEWVVAGGTDTSFRLGTDVVHTHLPHLTCLEVRLLEV